MPISFKNFITEAYHSLYKPHWRKYSDPTEIYSNSSKSEIDKLIHKHKVVRALLHKTKDESYFWDGSSILHRDVRHHLGDDLNKSSYFHVLISNRGVEPDDYYGETEGIMKHPWVKRNYPEQAKE